MGLWLKDLVKWTWNKYRRYLFKNENYMGNNKGEQADKRAGELVIGEKQNPGSGFRF